MIKAFLESLEDPYRPLVGPNYKLLKNAGFILPKNKVGRALYIIIHEIVVCFVITQYMELYAIQSNLDQVLTNLKISMLSVVCVCKVNSYLIRQKSWKQILEYVTEADQFERTDQNDLKNDIINKYTKYCRRVTYFYWFLLLITLVSTEIQPVLWYLTSSTLREGIRNGTAPFPHIFSSWMPFDKEHSPGCWITVGWHTFLCFYGPTVMGCFDTSSVIIIVFFGGKLELLRVRSAQILGQGGNGISNNEFETALKELHEMHYQLIKHSRLFNSLQSPIMFLYVVMCSLMLCASAYQLTSATNTAQKVIMAEYLIFGVVQLFIYCWHSNDVLLKSEELSMGPYESEWWAGTNQQRRNVLLLAGQFRITSHFSAGPFAELTLATFINILKGAYSYYTVLRT